jgi:hypothetical protein
VRQANPESLLLQWLLWRQGLLLRPVFLVYLLIQVILLRQLLLLLLLCLGYLVSQESRQCPVYQLDLLLLWLHLGQLHQ